MKAMRILAVSACAAALAFGSPASAALVFAGDPQDSDQIDFIDQSRTFQIRKADPALGALKGVVFNLSYTVDRDVYLYNPGDEPAPYDLTLSSFISLDIGNGLAAYSGISPDIRYQGTLGAETADIFSFKKNHSWTATLASPQQLSAFMGSGAISGSFTFLQNNVRQHPLFNDDSPDTGGYLLVSYYYGAAQTGAVPEPTTWAMMIFGFGAIGAYMRRVRQSVRLAYTG
jgi:hypothetical protein